MDFGGIWNSIITFLVVTGSLDVSRADRSLDCIEKSSTAKKPISSEDTNDTNDHFIRTKVWPNGPKTRCFYIGQDCEIPLKSIPENGAAILYGHNFSTNFSCHYNFNFSSAFGYSNTFDIYLEYNPYPKQKRKSEINMELYPFSVCSTM